MAQDFERLFARNVGTSAVSLMTSNSDDALIGIRVTNVLAATIQVDVYITSGGNDYHLAKINLIKDHRLKNSILFLQDYNLKNKFKSFDKNLLTQGNFISKNKISIINKITFMIWSD